MSDWQTLRDRLGLKFRPIETWPGKARYDRERSPFSAPFKDTLTLLERELRMLNTRNIVLQIAIPEDRLRLDGLPRADARTSNPGIILTFDCKHGHLRIYFDGFTNWQHNLRAIGLHLENLRHAGLYGVGRDGEQYRGWKALLSGAESMTAADDAALWMARTLAENLNGLPEEWKSSTTAVAANLMRSAVMVKRAYRHLALRLHPDTGGSAEQFKRLNQANAILERYHGGR